VPENIHWDPAYTAEEATFVLRYDPDNAGALQDPEIEALRESFPEDVSVEFEDIAIPDHADVGEPEEEEQPPRGEGRRRMPSFGSYATPEMAVLIAGLFFAGSFLLVRSLTRR
jgi:hypothetical protein